MATTINIQVTGFVGSDPHIKTVGEQQVASFCVADDNGMTASERVG